MPFLGGLLGQIADLDGFALSFELISQMREEVQVSGRGAFGLSRLALLAFALSTGILCATHVDLKEVVFRGVFRGKMKVPCASYSRTENEITQKGSFV